MGRKILMLAATLVTCALADGPGRIYTRPQADDHGVLCGRSNTPLTHAIAVEHDHTRVFLATLADAGSSFRFPALPVGRYDLVLITRDGRVCEGLDIGGSEPAPDPASRKLLDERVTKADNFFNRWTIHRSGFSGDRAFLFVERLRDRTVLRQSGENLGAFLRRFEIIELQSASGDWQMIGTRHLYREETPVDPPPVFFRPIHLPALGGLRVTDTTRDTGLLNLPNR